MKFVRDLNAKDTSVGDGGRIRPSALCPRFEYKDALIRGKKQRFGERLVCQSGKLHEAPIEDEEHVNQRRAEIGLMRIELYSYMVARMMPQMCSAAQ
jgi:hypothetical protein